MVTPSDPDVRQMTPRQAVELAVGVFKNGDDRQAQRICSGILQAHPQQPEAYLLLGLIEERRGHLSVAEALISTAAEIAPDFQSAATHLERIQKNRKGVRAHPYTRDYLRSRSVYMDYPRNIAIETAGYCNARCVFCPHRKLERNRTVMSEDLFDKILRDLQEIPAYVPTNIFPNGVNEPLMDKAILGRLAKINAALPYTGITIFTNFNVMPNGFFEEIWTIQNIRGINVSFNAANEEDYRHAMGLDFRRTVDYLKRFMTENRTRRFLPGPVILSRVMDHTHKDAEFAKECESLFADFKHRVDFLPHVKNRTNWLGNSEGAQSPIPYPLPCGGWFDFDIFCNGMVPFCCTDANADYAIGDVNENSVLEIYNNKRFRTFREAHVSRETVHPCNTCSLLQ